MRKTLLTVLCLIGSVGPAFAQTGAPGVLTPLGVQPFPTLIIPPTPAGLTGMVHPWVGIITPQPMAGLVLNRVWVEPQLVPIQVYVRQPEGIPEVWETQVVQIPGYWATETTQGTIYPPRWTLENTGVGVYQWRPLPGYFQPRR